MRIVTTALLIAITITTCPVRANDPLDTHQVSDASEAKANPFGKPKSGEAGSSSPDASPLGGTGAQGGTSARRNPFSVPGQSRARSSNGTRSESGAGLEQLPNSQAPAATSANPHRSANPFTNAKNPAQPPPGPSSKGADQTQKSPPSTTLTSNQGAGGTRILYYCGEYRFLKKSSRSRKVAPGESPGQNNSAMARADANTFNNEDDCDPDSGILLSIYKFNGQTQWMPIYEALFVVGTNDDEVRANLPIMVRAMSITNGYEGAALPNQSLTHSMTCRKRGWAILVDGGYGDGRANSETKAWGCLTAGLSQSFDIAVRHYRKVYPGAEIGRLYAWRLDKASYRQFTGRIDRNFGIPEFVEKTGLHFKPSALVYCKPWYTGATKGGISVFDVDLCVQAARQSCGAGISQLDCKIQIDTAWFNHACAFDSKSSDCGPQSLSERFQKLRATEIANPRQELR